MKQRAYLARGTVPEGTSVREEAKPPAGQGSMLQLIVIPASLVPLVSQLQTEKLDLKLVKFNFI